MSTGEQRAIVKAAIERLAGHVEVLFLEGATDITFGQLARYAAEKDNPNPPGDDYIRQMLEESYEDVLAKSEKDVRDTLDTRVVRAVPIRYGRFHKTKSTGGYYKLDSPKDERTVGKDFIASGGNKVQPFGFHLVSPEHMEDDIFMRCWVNRMGKRVEGAIKRVAHEVQGHPSEHILTSAAAAVAQTKLQPKLTSVSSEPES